MQVGDLGFTMPLWLWVILMVLLLGLFVWCLVLHYKLVFCDNDRAVEINDQCFDHCLGGDTPIVAPGSLRVWSRSELCARCACDGIIGTVIDRDFSTEGQGYATLTITIDPQYSEMYRGEGWPPYIWLVHPRR